ncbi:MAG: phosphate regulon sensor histidine kinase PhoR [Gammaproteobacteria bacterium]|nr:MAG: phosphate regulon sensor histidine kinase PhoR [Gammaproteobacteria bacterium]
MRRNTNHYVQLLVLGAIGCALVGELLGSVAWGLVAGLAAYLTWTLSQAFRLRAWLARGQLSDPPESHGLWGELFDGLYNLQLQHYKARDRLQAFINRIQESTNALRDAVIMTNSRGEMEWWNQAAESLLSLRSPEDRGEPIYNLVRSPEFKRYFISRVYDDPLTIASPRSPDTYVRFQITLFGEEQDRLIVASDVTRLHRLEQMRRDFVSNVSHELRTPLTVIEGYLETLVDHAEDLPARYQRMIQQMHVQSRRMDALVTDLLMLSRIESQGDTLKNEHVDVPALLNTIHQEVLPLARDKHQHLILCIDWDGGLMGDAHQLRSCFSNLIINAIKYTPEHGEIRIRWMADEAGGGARLSVSDTGIGIDPIHIPRLTERFYRADPSRTPNTGGTGLGLAIVKHVLLNHNARLDIQSQPGEGSVFTCLFPDSRVVSGTRSSQTTGAQ